MSNQEIPKIKKTADIGDTPFYFIGKTESILQGWDKTIGKTIYLFRTDSGKWGYFDKETNQVIDVNQWREKAALISGHWVKMALYHRVHLKFINPISYSAWDSVAKKQYPVSTQEAIVTITDSSYKSLIEQMSGRDGNSTYKFLFVSRKIGDRKITYVKSALWVEPS